MHISSSRRGFIRGLAGASALGLGGCSTFCGSCGKIRLAAVGIGGKGLTDWLPMVRSGKAELVAWCDADEKQREKAINHKLVKAVPGLADKLATLPFFDDARKLLDKAGILGIQAMTISTPDHMHAPIAISAMKQGIHVYVQKPLVRTLWELEYFNRTAKEYGVITQMGNQGSALDSMRRCTEVVQSGIIGEATEVHVWTNRPVWPQGAVTAAATLGDGDPVQPGLNWDAWIGTAKMRPFKGKHKPEMAKYDPWKLSPNVYHQFSWRAFFDFGCGAFGDMACHTMNMPFRGLELGIVSAAECIKIEDKNDICYPMKSIVKMTYAPRDSKARPGVRLPEVTLYWYDGNIKPDAEIMPEVVATLGKVPNTGCYFKGTKGSVVMMDDYGGKCMLGLKGEAKMVDMFEHEAAKAVARVLPFRSDAANKVEKGEGAAAVSADGHYVEFLDAINGDGPVYRETNSRCYADVDFSVPIMEGILVGCIAQQVPGKLAWDSAAQKFVGSDAANALLKPYIRPGWEF